MVKRKFEEQSIQTILGEIIIANNLQEGINKVDVSSIWKSKMGNGVNSYTTAIELKKGKLYVQLSSSVLREELAYGKSKIIKMLNDELKSEVVQDIVFR